MGPCTLFFPALFWFGLFCSVLVVDLSATRMNGSGNTVVKVNWETVDGPPQAPTVRSQPGPTSSSNGSHRGGFMEQRVAPGMSLRDGSMGSMDHGPWAMSPPFPPPSPSSHWHRHAVSLLDVSIQPRFVYSCSVPGRQTMQAPPRTLPLGELSINAKSRRRHSPSVV